MWTVFWIFMFTTPGPVQHCGQTWTFGYKILLITWSISPPTTILIFARSQFFQKHCTLFIYFKNSWSYGFFFLCPRGLLMPQREETSSTKRGKVEETEPWSLFRRLHCCNLRKWPEKMRIPLRVLWPDYTFCQMLGCHSNVNRIPLFPAACNLDIRSVSFRIRDKTIVLKVAKL